MATFGLCRGFWKRRAGPTLGVTNSKTFFHLPRSDFVFIHWYVSSRPRGGKRLFEFSKVRKCYRRKEHTSGPKSASWWRSKKKDRFIGYTWINARDHYGHSPMHKCVMANQEDILKFMLTHHPEHVSDKDNVSSTPHLIFKSQFSWSKRKTQFVIPQLKPQSLHRILDFYLKEPKVA